MWVLDKPVDNQIDWFVISRSRTAISRYANHGVIFYLKHLYSILILCYNISIGWRCGLTPRTLKCLYRFARRIYKEVVI